MAPDRGQAASKPSSRAWDALTPSLSEWILDATASMHLAQMTPVQASTIPLFIGHKDVVVEAVTGSGKTLAFLIPLVERICRLEEATPKHHVAAIVISPTRELATQIYHVLTSLLAFHGPSTHTMRAAKKLCDVDREDAESNEEEQEQGFSEKTPKVLPQLLLGGSHPAARDLSRFLTISPNVLIGTPGRLLEILSSPYVHAPQSSFEVLVLDEADRLLDLGFKDDLTKILGLLPKQRRTGLFSASVSEAVDQIIRVGLRNPVRITVKVKGANGLQDKRTPASLRMAYLVTPASKKLLALQQLLLKMDPRPLRTIVYLSTCAAVDYFQHLLPSIFPPDMTLVPLHGKHPSNVREKNFAKFVNSVSPAILLTTDVAARGLDVPRWIWSSRLTPSDPKVFIHRCGRAGRAGRKGLSVVFLQPGREEDYVAFLEVRKTPIDKMDDTDFELVDHRATELANRLRAIVLTDRALHDKAQKAFVSWVRSYSKHQASSIFRVADLDWNDLVQGWALLKLPKMPEAKNHGRQAIDLGNVDWDTFAYKDKMREKQRKQSQQAEHADGRDERKTHHDKKKRSSTVAWSENIDRKVTRDIKRTKREAKREYLRANKMTDAERQRHAETQRMVNQIREQQSRPTDKNEEFEGFD